MNDRGIFDETSKNREDHLSHFVLRHHLNTITTAATSVIPTMNHR